MYLRHSGRGALGTTRHANHHQFRGATLEMLLLLTITILRYLDLLLLRTRILIHARGRWCLRSRLKYDKLLTTSRRRSTTPPRAKYYSSSSRLLRRAASGY